MMLGDPVPQVAEVFGAPGEVEGVRDGGGLGLAERGEAQPRDRGVERPGDVRGGLAVPDQEESHLRILS